MVIKNTGFPVAFYPEIGRNAAPGKTLGAAAGAKADPAGRTDKIDFSARPEKTDAFLGDLKARLCDEIGRDADPARLRELKESVADGSYAADPGELSGILLFDRQG